MLTVLDYMGNAWKCDLSFIKGEDMVYCRIGGDWRHICNAIRLIEGYAVKLIVTEAKDNTVVTLKHVPLQCTHWINVKPDYCVGRKYIYQVNHYFMRCLVENGI